MANNLGGLDEIIKAIKFYTQTDKAGRDALLGVTRATATSNVSIASRAKLNVCQFPLLTSTTLSVNTYQKTSEILEQLYAQYLKLVIVNQLEVINLGDGDNKLSIVSKVHQNDNALSTYMDRNKEEYLRSNITARFEDAVPFLEMYNFSDKDLIDANKILLKPYNENFNNSNLNRNNLSEAFNETETPDGITSKYDMLSKLYAEQNRLDGNIRNTKEILLDKKENLTDEQFKNLSEKLKQWEKELIDVNKRIDELNEVIKKIMDRKTIYENEKKQAELASKKDFRKAFGSVSDFDNALIKKNNSLEPSILTFGLKYHTKGGSFEETKMALAVKTITHMVQSDELCFYINETITKKKFAFKALQVLTGEKEFSLRFLLGLDKAKRDAKADSTTAKWWRHLQDRRTASWIRAFRHKDPFIPNATIILSYEDYEIMKLMYKKDLIKDTKMAYQLTDLLFLMHLVIVNDVSNEIMIFNKDNRTWETYTLDKLQNEINTMNKMSSNKTLR